MIPQSPPVPIPVAILQGHPLLAKLSTKALIDASIEGDFNPKRQAF